MPLQVVAPAWHVAWHLSLGTGLDLSWVSQQHPLEQLQTPVLWEFPPQLCPSGWRELLGPTGFSRVMVASQGLALQWEPGTVRNMVWWWAHVWHHSRATTWAAFPVQSWLAHDWHILVAAALISSMQS